MQETLNEAKKATAASGAGASSAALSAQVKTELKTIREKAAQVKLAEETKLLEKKKTESAADAKTLKDELEALSIARKKAEDKTAKAIADTEAAEKAKRDTGAAKVKKMREELA